jgi:hypothetical protein
MFMQFGQVLGRGVAVQLLHRVFVIVFRFLAWSMNVEMRMLVRMGVFVGVRMHCPVCMPVLVGMDMRMHMGVSVSVFD